MPDLIESLAGLIETAGVLEYPDLSAETADSASAVVADVLASVAYGMRHRELTSYVHRLPRSGDGAPGARVLSSPGTWSTAQEAAFVHGCAAVADELDESLPGGGHPGAHVVPAALAVAQAEHRSGQQLLAAVVAGYEVAAQLFQAHRPMFPAHPHGFYGAVGAAVACAKLEGNSPYGCAAIVAAAPVLPGWSASLSGATARNSQVGLAAAHAVLSGRLAHAGFTGDLRGAAEAVPKLRGQVDVHGAGSTVMQLDRHRPLINDSVLRRHPAAGPLQPAIEAALSLGPTADTDIERVQILVPERVLKFGRRPAPNTLSARFSLPYVVLTALRSESRTPDFAFAEHIDARTPLVTVGLRGDGLDETTVQVTYAGGLMRAATKGPAAPRHASTPLSALVRAKWEERAHDHAASVLDDAFELHSVEDCADWRGAS